MKKILLFVIFISICALFLNRDKIGPVTEKYLYKIWPPKRRIYETFTEKEREAIDTLAKKIKGRIVWASNRKGNHDIYMLDLSRKTIKNITNHPHQDLGPKFSPDGRWIAFSRSKNEWASFRDSGAWDIYAINLEKGKEIFLTHAFHPTWAGDSRHVIFGRDSKVYKIDIYTQEIELIFDGNNPPTYGDCGEPFMFKDNSKIAIGTRTHEFRGIGILDLKTKELNKIFHGQACHVFLGPANKFIYWVSHGGKGGTQVFYSPADNADPKVFMDLPGEHSHEYFPRISNDARWLIWGASHKGHEHDAADYEIFLWKIGTPWDNYIRFTYSEANDQWPDLYVE